MKYSAHKIFQATDFEDFLAKAGEAKERYDRRCREIQERQRDRSRQLNKIRALNMSPELAVLAALRHVGICTSGDLYGLTEGRFDQGARDVAALVRRLQDDGYIIRETLEESVNHHERIIEVQAFCLELNE